MFVRDKVEKEYLPLYEKLGYGTTTWSPLASGLLSGKYNDGIPKGTRLDLPDMAWLKDEILQRGRIEKVRKLALVAKDVGCSMSQLAIAWCLKNPHVSTVITGASKKEQVVENMHAADVADRLTSDAMARIDTILDS
jgi:aryl-alcohol dehydrogenase-like predicted oxidoreductase